MAGRLKALVWSIVAGENPAAEGAVEAHRRARRDISDLSIVGGDVFS